MALVGSTSGGLVNVRPTMPQFGHFVGGQVLGDLNQRWANNVINTLPQVQAAAANRSNTYSVIDAGLKNLRGILGESLNRKKTQAQKDRDRALLATKGSLAGRGLLFSGETGYQEGLDQENYSNTLGDLMDAYNTSLSQGELNAALNKLSADSAYQQALASAYDFVTANPQIFTPPWPT